MTDEQTKPQGSVQITDVVTASAKESSADANIDECAHIVFEVVPQVMQNVRAEMRRRRGAEISVLQLRALTFLRRHPGATLSVLAEHVGLTLPSMSSQVSGLVARNLIDRSVSVEDRRFVTLTLTEQGKTHLETARQGTQESLAKTLSVLAPNERATVVEAMHLLGRVFAPPSLEAPQTESPNPSNIV